MRRTRLFLLAALLASGCAWTRRENRPIWNAFEQNLVPEETGWFVATLPLTVPGGIASILLDTFVAHPVQVVDDAWDDASELWRDGRPDFQEHYWSEMAFLPVRAALTPTYFLISFLGRSLFDIRSKEEAEQAAELGRQVELAAQKTLQAWLLAVAAGAETRYDGLSPGQLTDPVRTAAAAALAQGKALGRLHVWRLAITGSLKGVVDPVQGLRDPDPVVRFLVLRELRSDAAVPRELIDALLQDPVESIRGAARQRWP